MPTYDYECPTCGVFEHFQSITSPKLESCPQCGKGKVIRLLSAGGGLVLKGSGWYVTDFKHKSGSATSAVKPVESKPTSAQVPKADAT